MRYLMQFSYDGSLFSGYQIQKGKRTVEEEIEKVLTKLNHEKPVKIYASGRTDAKVHALEQSAHFSFEQTNVENLKYKLNKLLPKDIYVENIKEVSENFHARYNIKKKTYLYKINCGQYNPFDVNYIYQYNKILNIENIKEACKYFIGEHDFTSFTKASGKKDDMIRIIYNIDIKYKDEILYLEFTGNGFLQYMVRNIVGFLIEVGEGKKNPSEVNTILNKKNRKYASFTASPVGLYLKCIEY